MEKQNNQQLCGLYEALARFQGECPIIEKTKQVSFGNTKYSYADLAGILKTIRAPLSKNGLAVIQVLQQQADGQYLITKLCHKSGESIDSSVKIEYVGKDIKQLGAAITYYRKYALSAMLGIASDDDVDALETTNDFPKIPDRLTEAQVRILETQINGDQELRDSMLKWAQVDKIENIAPSKYEPILKAISKKKEMQNGK